VFQKNKEIFAIVGSKSVVLQYRRPLSCLRQINWYAAKPYSITVIEHDPAINELYNLPMAYYVERKFVDDKWIKKAKERK